MDDWGDPWADDSHSHAAKRPPAIETLGAASKESVVTPVLTGFFDNDEARWGDNDDTVDTFSGWAGAHSPTKDLGAVEGVVQMPEDTFADPKATRPLTPTCPDDEKTAPEPAARSPALPAAPELQTGADALEANPFADATSPSTENGSEETAIASHQPHETPEVDSSASDSATTIAAEGSGTAADDFLPSSAAIHSEEFEESGASTRTSTAPSDTSHIYSESTRTSFDEDNGVRKTDESEGKPNGVGEPATDTKEEDQGNDNNASKTDEHEEKTNGVDAPMDVQGHDQGKDNDTHEIMESDKEVTEDEGDKEATEDEAPTSDATEDGQEEEGSASETVESEEQTDSAETPATDSKEDDKEDVPDTTQPTESVEEPNEAEQPPTDAQEEAQEDDDDDDFGDFEEEVEDVEDDATVNESSPATPMPASATGFPATGSGNRSETPVPLSEINFQPDLGLVNKLFPLPESTRKFETAEDTPLTSRSARKAWYRLTRKETMREFESGSMDNSYVRVGWARSRIRADLLKTVSKWQTEERLNGRYGKPGALFGWDTGSSAVKPFPDAIAGRHKRQTSAAPPVKHPAEDEAKTRPQSLVLPSRRRSSVVEPEPVAQFNWSTSQSIEPPKTSLSFKPTLDSIAGSAPPTKTSFEQNVKSPQSSPLFPPPQSSSPVSAPPAQTAFGTQYGNQQHGGHMSDMASMLEPPTASAPPTKTTFDSSEDQTRPQRPTSMILPSTPKVSAHARSVSSGSITGGGSAAKIAELLGGAKEKGTKSPTMTVKNSATRAVPTSPLAVEVPREDPIPAAMSSQKSKHKPEPLDTKISAPSTNASATNDNGGWGDMVESPGASSPAQPRSQSPWQTATSSSSPDPAPAQTKPTISLASPPARTTPKLASLDTDVGPRASGSASGSATATNANAADNDDDDEWGEMVQSPAPTSPAMSSPAFAAAPWNISRGPSALNTPLRVPTPLQRPHPPSPLVPIPIRSTTMPSTSTSSYFFPPASASTTPSIAPSPSPKPMTPSHAPSASMSMSMSMSSAMSSGLPLPPQPATPANPPDPWAEVDFSIFEKPAKTASPASSFRSQAPSLGALSMPRQAYSPAHSRNASSPVWLSSPPRAAGFGSPPPATTAVTFDQILQPAGKMTAGPTFDAILGQANPAPVTAAAALGSPASSASAGKAGHRRNDSEEKVPRRASDVSVDDLEEFGAMGMSGLASPPPFVKDLDKVRSPPRFNAGKEEVVRRVVSGLPDLEYMLR